MDNLWHRVKSGDEEAREELILSYAHLTRYVVDRMNIPQTPVASHDDLLSHAIMGLIDAVEKFDPAKDVKFETYASVRIRGAVLDALKSLDWMPRSLRATETELKRTFAQLEAELGRPATDEEVARVMGMSVDDLNDTLGSVAQSAVQSLEDMMYYGEEGPELAATGAKVKPGEDPAMATELAERRRMLAIAIDALPERERLVVSLYYKEGLTLKEIAAVLGVTESRACQLHSKAVVRLQGKLARHADLFLMAA
jgi:RNA polymerase sigma factor for flagellar operon FliA